MKLINDDQVDGIIEALAREAHNMFSEMTDTELEQLGKDEGSMPSIPLVEKKDVDGIYSKELDDYHGFEPENELRDARKEMQDNKRYLDVGDMGTDITNPETSFPYQKGGEADFMGYEEDVSPEDVKLATRLIQGSNEELTEGAKYLLENINQHELLAKLSEGGVGSGPQGGGGDDFYEAGMMQPSSSGGNNMYRDMSDVKHSGQDQYLDMAQKDYDDPTYELSNQDYEDVFNQGKIREGTEADSGSVYNEWISELGDDGDFNMWSEYATQKGVSSYEIDREWDSQLIMELGDVNPAYAPMEDEERNRIISQLRDPSLKSKYSGGN